MSREDLPAEVRTVVHCKEPGQHAETRALLIHLERGGELPEGQSENDGTVASTTVQRLVAIFEGGGVCAAAPIIAVISQDVPDRNPAPPRRRPTAR